MYSHGMENDVGSDVDDGKESEQNGTACDHKGIKMHNHDCHFVIDSSREEQDPKMSQNVHVLCSSDDVNILDKQHFPQTIDNNDKISSHLASDDVYKSQTLENTAPQESTDGQETCLEYESEAVQCQNSCPNYDDPTNLLDMKHSPLTHDHDDSSKKQTSNSCKWQE